MLFEAEIRKKKYQVIVDRTRTTWEVSIQADGKEPKKISIPQKDFAEADSVISFLHKGSSYLIDVVGDGTDYNVYTRGSYRNVKIFNDEMLLHESLKSGKALGGDDSLTAGMPGKIVKVMVKEGQEVDEGTPLLIMEAMKMENEMKASTAGKVKKVLVAAGDNVDSGAQLILFE